MTAGQDLHRDAANWRSHAFGLDIRASFQAPGLPPGAGLDSLPSTRLDLASEEEIDDAWRPQSPERLLEEKFVEENLGEGPDRTIDFDSDNGYRLFARHFGLAWIASNGARVLCAPPGATDWSWQRFLVGRVLPWTAVLSGREVFHASAVQIGGRAIAIVAMSSGGKTSLGLRLVLRGAGFMTDDVLALEPSPAGVIAHPGANIAAVRKAEKAQIDKSEWKRLGKVLGTSGKTYLEVEREFDPLPLSAIYFLRERSGDGPIIETGVDAKELLGSTFISGVHSPQRLTGLLDLCAQLSSSVSLFWLAVEREAGTAATAEALWEHASAAVAG